MQVGTTGHELLSFGRRLREDEKTGCQNAINNGLRTLDKSLGIISPTNCSPSYKSEDVGVGQPYSDISCKELYPFLRSLGFSQQQRQPSGLGKPSDPSPYVSNSSAYDTAIIDLKPLTKACAGGLISEDTYKSIVENNPKKGLNRSAYLYNQGAHKKALQEAYQTFKAKRKNISELDETERAAISELDKDFKQFKKKYGSEQEKNAIYSILSDTHNNDYWPNWDSEIDKKLFSKKGTPSQIDARNARLLELKNKHAEKIDSFLFSQMLAKKTLEDGKSVMEKNGIASIADIPVAFSDAEVWGNTDLFLDDIRMGCSEPWSSEPQKWGFFVLDPDKLFNDDGSLGESGEFLYDKYKRAFAENKGGVRIDHIVGLMDPYVYSIDGANTENRLYSELYRGVNGGNCDRILKEIVLKAANDIGLDSSAIIAEDLGYMPGNTKQALNDLGIGGITVTQWFGPNEVWNTAEANTAMVANHDTASARELYPNKTERKNKFIELFSSGAKNIQIFWTDLFGIKERYNQPGVSGDQNWSLRMTENFTDDYYKAAEDDEALNIPEVVLEANRRRNPNFDNQHGNTAKELQKYSDILKERE